MVKHLLLLPAVLVLAWMPAPAGSPTPQKKTAAPATAATEKTPAITARVKEIYKIDCAMCHGDTGDGKTDLAKGMALTLADFGDPKTFESKTDQQLFDAIRKGKDKMPPEDAPRATDEQIRGLVEYIRMFSKEHPATPVAEPAAAPAPASTSTSPTSN
jgi:mono/diheme cytochrome c family protein